MILIIKNFCLYLSFNKVQSPATTPFFMVMFLQEMIDAVVMEQRSLCCTTSFKNIKKEKS